VHEEFELDDFFKVKLPNAEYRECFGILFMGRDLIDPKEWENTLELTNKDPQKIRKDFVNKLLEFSNELTEEEKKEYKKIINDEFKKIQ